MRRLAVLGGSTPFTVALVEALAARPGIAPQRLVLHGRHRGRLGSMADYARHRLGPAGWAVQTGTALSDVLGGADVVVHQIRYGDLSGRAQDERFAHGHGSAPDETLGPGALRCLLRSLPDLRQTAAAVREHAPDAWVVNLTNPLSATTSVLADHVGGRCLGVCELPEATARAAADALGLRPGDLEWSYAGLNHRGFVHGLHHDGRDVLPGLVQALGRSRLGGISAETIGALGAVPTKYFGLMSGPGPLYVGRAAEVAAVRADLAAEVRADPTRCPPSLGRRPTPWYDQALVPILDALSPDGPGCEVVATVPDGSGPAFERRGHLSGAGFTAHPEPEASAEVGRWVASYAAHERAVLDLCRAPSEDALRRAVKLDPLVAPSRADAVAADLRPLLG